MRQADRVTMVQGSTTGKHHVQSYHILQPQTNDHGWFKLHNIGL